ncbi:hypothetical protein GGE09_003544 [Roseobacter sp. N2S]|nr:hypothetical protein [Roseobacter sp. N2S]
MRRILIEFGTGIPAISACWWFLDGLDAFAMFVLIFIACWGQNLARMTKDRRQA